VDDNSWPLLFPKGFTTPSSTYIPRGCPYPLFVDFSPRGESPLLHYLNDFQLPSALILCPRGPPSEPELHRGTPALPVDPPALLIRFHRCLLFPGYGTTRPRFSGRLVLLGGLFWRPYRNWRFFCRTSRRSLPPQNLSTFAAFSLFVRWLPIPYSYTHVF